MSSSASLLYTFAVLRGMSSLRRADPRALLRAIRSHDVRELNRLAAGGADVNWVNEHGMFPLMMATRMGKAPIVTSLLELGANPSLVDNVRAAAAGEGVFSRVRSAGRRRFT